MPVSPLAYFLLFAVPALLPLAYLLGTWTGWLDLFAFFPIVVLQVVVPILDAIVGDNPQNVPDDQVPRLEAARVYRWITLCAVPVQFGILAWATWVAAGIQAFDTAGFIGWAISTGYVGGILAINVGHELIHKRSPVERTAGGLLLSTVGYGTFKVEHVRGHHVNVSTPEDASSADYNESVYRFIPRAIVCNVSNAWRLERNRLKRLELPWWHWRNELIWWTALSALWLSLAAFFFGVPGLVFMLLQALEAIVSLETINYIEHYGLRRVRLPNGRYERPNPTHSWNSDALLSNLLLLQLPRHSDHHAYATRRYQVLRHHEESPQLPAGYAAMFALAWIPPLWRRVMNPRVKQFASASN